MPPQADNCWRCGIDMDYLPDELRKEFCWVNCPKCWMLKTSSLSVHEPEFLAMCERLGIDVDPGTEE